MTMIAGGAAGDYSTSIGDGTYVGTAPEVPTSYTAKDAASSPATTTNAPSTQGMIRNINQTVQEREIIKTCPDLIIYLDGKTYLLNPYIANTTANQPYTFVSFNDYVQNFSASVDVDQLVPTCNFTLQVPNFSKYLFQAPGGNNLIDTMMEVQIFAKGYYASGNGNTVYHRVFKGVTSHIAHTDNGMFLEISVQCLGVMHLLEHMYQDLSPALVSNSPLPVTAMSNKQFDMDPYMQLADEFKKDISFEGFELNSIKQNKVKDSQWAAAVTAGYCNKWQTILMNIRKEVHITGYSMGKPLSLDKNSITETPEDAQGSGDPKMQAAKVSLKPLLAQNAPNPDKFVDILRGYFPDMSLGALQLTNGRIVSRLERIKTIVQLIGFEGFQDLDGTIIFKPPLYNLDVTNIGTSNSSTSAVSSPSSSVNLTDANNPFIVHLSEIESESESEDQQAIKATRMTIQVSIAPGQKMVADATTAVWRSVAQHIDIPKMAKFGLREEPCRTLGWLGKDDLINGYVYAVSELNRQNRGWRTYNLTIPLRPELKLGFPMYLPHKDMYGYIKTISISYSQGGAATMTIMLDTLRKRPVFFSPASQQGASGFYTTQPNLVMEWTVAPTNTSTANDATSAASTGPVVMNSSNGLATATKSNSTVFNGQLLNIPATQTQPQAKPIYAEEMEVISARRSQYGTSWATKADTTTKSFRVQNDKASADDAKNKNGNGQAIQAGQPFFSAVNWHDAPVANAATTAVASSSTAATATSTSTPVTTTKTTVPSIVAVTSTPPTAASLAQEAGTLPNGVIPYTGPVGGGITFPTGVTTTSTGSVP